MRKKNYIMGLFSILALVILAGMAMAGTMQVPADNGRVSGAAFVVTMNNTQTTTANTTACQLSFNSLVTNTTGIVPADGGNTTNVSAGQRQFNFTVNTFSLQDSNDYNVTVICNNVTAVESSSAAGVIVDNTNPQVPTGLTTSVTSRNFDITFTVVSANTTTCGVDWSSSSPVSGIDNFVTVNNSATCTVAITNANDGNYGYVAIASDGSNQTRSNEAFLKISTGRDEGTTAPARAAALAEAKGGVMATLASMFNNLVAWLKGLFN